MSFRQFCFYFHIYIQGKIPYITFDLNDQGWLVTGDQISLLTALMSCVVSFSIQYSAIEICQELPFSSTWLSCNIFVAFLKKQMYNSLFTNEFVTRMLLSWKKDRTSKKKRQNVYLIVDLLNKLIWEFKEKLNMNQSGASKTNDKSWFRIK